MPDAGLQRRARRHRRARSSRLKGEFADGVWRPVTLGTDAVYGVPQDVGADDALLPQGHLQASSASRCRRPGTSSRPPRGRSAQKDPKQLPRPSRPTTPAGSPGSPSRPAPTGGRSTASPGRSASTTTPRQQVADYWGGLVDEGVIDNQPMYTPEWNKALNDGTQIGWPSAVWGPAVLEGNAPDTKGKWAMAPLPQWTAATRSPATGAARRPRSRATRSTRPRRPEFARWLNTDPEAVTALVEIANVYPASTDGQAGAGADDPPAFMPDDQPTSTRSPRRSRRPRAASPAGRT